MSCLLPLLGASVEAKLVAAAVLPHGDFAYDPSLLARINPLAHAQALKLNAGAAAVGNLLAQQKPDVIILSTPHGLQTTWDLGIYQNLHLEGKALVGRDMDASFGKAFPKFSVEMDARTPSTFAQQLFDALASAGRNVTLLRGWNDVLPLPLHWGEVLALEHVAKAFGDRRRLQPPLVALGLPLSRYNHSSSVAAGFRAMGRDLGRVLESVVARIAFVVSTDLSHRHWSNNSFGFSKYAAPFDAAVGRWAASLDPAPLFVESSGHVDEVYACGWLGLVLLHGALEAAAHSAGAPSEAPLNVSFRAKLAAPPAHPTYYGMMAASFERAFADAKGQETPLQQSQRLRCRHYKLLGALLVPMNATMAARR